jgi:hypothetical protein
MDVHVRRAVTTALRLRSIAVLTAQEDGSAELADDLLLRRATELLRVLVSQDEDLIREGAKMVKREEEFSGIIYAHQDLELIASATSQDEWRGRIEFLPLR